MKPTLDRLLSGIADAPALSITGISTDSRRLESGSVFLACQGMTSHGLDFAQQAVDSGVAAIVWDRSTGSPPDAEVTCIAVDDLSARIGDIANRWFGAPSDKVRVTGVTGTNGKTTVAYLAAQCLNAFGRSCGYIGTLGSGIKQIAGDGSMTTPSCVELHETLAEFRDQGATDAAMEISSHALDQGRVDGVHIDAAIFTNLSRDHIDYHGSMDAYFEAKAGLFMDYGARCRIVNLDDEYGELLAERCGAGVTTVATDPSCRPNGRPFVFARQIEATDTGSQFVIESSWGDASVSLPLTGQFNVANAVSVIALLLCNDTELGDAVRLLESAKAPAGRMERVNPGFDAPLPAVFVDYSHTPASIEVALTALRRHCDGKLWCVFGCGGDRDRGKRPMMGAAAEKHSDFAIVTSDNPRTEKPQQILDDILKGMSVDTLAMVDRREAIQHAVTSAGAEDVVLIAGKGHENYQVVGDRTLHFSDYEEARTVLRARAGADT